MNPNASLRHAWDNHPHQFSCADFASQRPGSRLVKGASERRGADTDPDPAGLSRIVRGCGSSVLTRRCRCTCHHCWSQSLREAFPAPERGPRLPSRRERSSSSVGGASRPVTVTPRIARPSGPTKRSVRDRRARNRNREVKGRRIGCWVDHAIGMVIREWNRAREAGKALCISFGGAVAFGTGCRAFT